MFGSLRSSGHVPDQQVREGLSDITNRKAEI